MVRPSDYALRALFNEETGASEGWEIISLKAQEGDAVFGVAVGRVHVPFMEVGSVTIMQYIVSSWLDQQRAAKQEPHAHLHQES